MNILQHIEAPQTFCVSLNSNEQIDQSKVLRRFVYHHPVFNSQSMKAQARKDETNGVCNTWFCGAYWYNGFHEDGVKSALDVVRGLRAYSSGHSSKGRLNMPSALKSCLLVGNVRHRRFTPIEHELDYTLFMPCLDLDELDGLKRKIWGFGDKWWHWARFKRSDCLGTGT